MPFTYKAMPGKPLLLEQFPPEVAVGDVGMKAHAAYPWRPREDYSDVVQDGCLLDEPQIRSEVADPSGNLKSLASNKARVMEEEPVGSREPSIVFLNDFQSIHRQL